MSTDSTRPVPPDQTGPPTDFAPTGVPARPSPEPDRPRDVVLEHSYDGIQEYDNPMPGWWRWIFYATIVYSILYVAALHGFGWIRHYEDDLALETRALDATKAAYAKAHGGDVPDELALLAATKDPGQVSAGAQTFTATCAPCHGAAGQGVIGPNLTDDRWLHGGHRTEIFRTIQHGVPDKGMPAWGAMLKPEQLVQLVAYIGSIQGSNPPNPKPPQGEPFVEGGTPPEAPPGTPPASVSTGN